MPADQRPEITFRCPVCFGRENDVYMFHEGELYYCMKCSFSGTEQQVREAYADLRKKYRWILKRVTLEEQRKL